MTQWRVTGCRRVVGDYLLWVEQHQPTGQFNWGLSTKQEPPLPYMHEKVWTTVRSGTTRSLQAAKAGALAAHRKETARQIDQLFEGGASQ